MKQQNTCTGNMVETGEISDKILRRVSQVRKHKKRRVVRVSNEALVSPKNGYGHGCYCYCYC
jgi:hypothetical protein